MTDRIKDGGPAFPLQPESTPEAHYLGMTLRDWFAGQALAGLLSGATESECRQMSKLGDGDTQLGFSIAAIMYADAMLSAREGEQ